MFVAVYAGVEENFIGPLESSQYVAWLEAREAAGVPAAEPEPEPTPDPAPVTPAVPPIDVRDYGAVGNGAANDTAALTAAVAALKAAGPGHTLLLPAGVYRVSATFQFLDMSDFTVRGEGATIKPFGSMTVADYNGDVIRFTNCSNFVVEGLTLDGNRASRDTGEAVTFRVFGSSNFTVRNCTMKNATWDHVYVTAIMDNGQTVARTHDGRFENCTIEDAWRSGVSVTNGYNIAFAGNTIRGIQGQDPQTGIQLEANAEDGADSVTDILVEGNTFDDCSGRAVYAASLHPASRITVSGNTITNCSTAIALYGNEHQILNNTFDGGNTIKIGIGVTGNNALIQGNTVRNGRHIAIYAAGSGNVIKNNTIVDYGFADSGCCIHTEGGLGGGLIEGNTIRKTIPDTDWQPIRRHASDTLGVNYRYGVQGADGAF